MRTTSLPRGVACLVHAWCLLAGSAIASTVFAQAPASSEAASASASAPRAVASSPSAFADGVKAFDAGQPAEAFRLWLPLATQGRAQAQFNIAFLYEQGLGVARSDVEAARWYLAAAEGGDTTARSKIASLYAAGIGVAKDPDKAAYWSAQAANGGTDAPDAAPPPRAPLPDRSAKDPEDITTFNGGRFVLFRANDGECVIALQGRVTTSADLKFDEVVGKAKSQHCAQPLTLLLESPGGEVDAGIDLGRSVHIEGMHTVARYGCASSCSIIFLGGSERTIWGSRGAIGLHQPNLMRMGKKECYTSFLDPPVVAMRHYIHFVVPEHADQIIDVMLHTSCTSISWKKGRAAIDLGVATRIEAEHEDVFGPLSARIPKAASAPH